VALKRQYPGVMLYVDEAHGIGVRGPKGLGVAEEQGVVADIDFLCGTFGKALASVGGYIVCSQLVRDYLVNKMRTLIFTTALPPVCLEWTLFILNRLDRMQERRQHLALISAMLRDALVERGYDCPSASHIVPMTIGPSDATILEAEQLQRLGFYVLPVRPPTVPEGTSRLRFSLTAGVSEEEVRELIQSLEFKV
jgi:8-amino-7-oxononanoate synthase